MGPAPAPRWGQILILQVIGGAVFSEQSILSTEPYLVESAMPRPWRPMAISYIAQSLGVVLLVELAMFAPAVVAPLQQHYEAIALTSATPPEPKPSVAIKVVTAPAKVAPAIVLPRAE